MPRAGFEPAAYPLGGDRSIRLSYRGRWLIFTQTEVGCVNRLFPRITGDTPAGRIPCMSRAPLLDMSDPPFNVVHMSKMIQVRNVPDEMHRALKASAAAEGLSLSDYIKR